MKTARGTKGKRAAAAVASTSAASSGLPRLRPGTEVFSCFRMAGGARGRGTVWYRGSVKVAHRDGTVDVRYEDEEVRKNIPRSHLTTTLPSVVSDGLSTEIRECTLWSTGGGSGGDGGGGGDGGRSVVKQEDGRSEQED
ncbi:unnamed protein product, partial [Ectocarpus sp. 12 AP-2014]